MPQVFVILGYIVYFWSNENDEPIHVHVCKGSPQKDATKVWITEDGPVLEHNKSKIPKKDLKRILAWIAMNDELIIKKWQFHFSK
ncbi:MAG: DUF4160 domain-containing protein [Anaerovibrio sp.]|uniref:DUF4160 domain-containing protein n=1 Tax=Anaerovibrio lipolyticus TaxID=82374 RepID=UPI001F3950C4|nr:DUF4160 domain-containing protein [Anaerovibrio lipolyticus]MCF2601599.1 DUF4160 domain-containing protein [Anaerovibrio lipolyticus]MCI7266381.1 DUF4160 domain-containing protein [Veillonellaceae bacterium]MEE0457806.1 DUF4160 domain-containing protein [Anaerovibrio sp.]